ncbi:MAG: hypothetical protein N2645_15795 [Clostridia bacterium]|nr:hypothetical protein [Clostridia bacterium]
MKFFSKMKGLGSLLTAVLIGTISLSFAFAVTRDLPSTREGIKISGFIAPELENVSPQMKAGFKVEIPENGMYGLTDSNGYFEILNVPQATINYTLKITKQSYLKRLSSPFALKGNASIGSAASPILMKAGDFVQDDAINMTDIVDLLQFFNSAEGDGKYNLNADLNMDRAVNMTDIVIIINNFNKSSANYDPITITQNTTSPSPTPTSTPIIDEKANLKFTFTKTSETATTYKGTITVENPNKAYAWNGSYFAIWDFEFETSSTITSTSINDGSVIKTVNGDKVKFDIGWLSVFPLGKKLTIDIEATKKGTKIYPQNFSANYVRANDISYPEYAGLPSSWYKGKQDLKAEDLIKDVSSYYNTSVKAVSEKAIIYNPYHPTQIWIGQCKRLTKLVNETPNVRIWVPSRFMAMGLGFNYETFKLNPNYMVALGTKENFACGILHHSSNIQEGTKVIVDGEVHYWPFIPMADGPFQQESQNFNDCKANYPDYLPANANHPAYCQTSTSPDDPAFVSTAITCGISLTITREHLNAVKDVNYKQFMEQAKDSWAEYYVLDYGYNMGVDEIFKAKIFGSRRQEALNSLRIDETLGLVGDSGHVQEVRYMLEDINNETQNIYDEKITWADMEKYLQRMRMFYASGVPTDSEWNLMKDDVRRAFDVLSAHWGGQTVSYRYDFLTLLRVMKQHLPKPYTPRPAGANWYDIITGQKLD